MLKQILNFFRKNKKIKVPTHISIITDGNGRWATKKNLPRYIGHIYGSKIINKIINYSKNIGIKYLSFYIFSKENWKRSNEEINVLMNLLEKYLIKFILSSNKDVLLKIIGSYENLPIQIINLIKQINNNYICSNKENKLTVILCVNYSGRDELLNAIKHIIKNKISLMEINENLINKYLYTYKIPEPDLIIRTSGEKRLSNFFIWQCIYSEFYFTKILWPDFTINDFKTAIFEYNTRSRRFGST